MKKNFGNQNLKKHKKYVSTVILNLLEAPKSD